MSLFFSNPAQNNTNRSSSDVSGGTRPSNKIAYDFVRKKSYKVLIGKKNDHKQRGKVIISRCEKYYNFLIFEKTYKNIPSFGQISSSQSPSVGQVLRLDLDTSKITKLQVVDLKTLSEEALTSTSSLFIDENEKLCFKLGVTSLYYAQLSQGPPLVVDLRPKSLSQGIEMARSWFEKNDLIRVAECFYCLTKLRKYMNGGLLRELPEIWSLIHFNQLIFSSSIELKFWHVDFSNIEEDMEFVKKDVMFSRGLKRLLTGQYLKFK